MLDGNPLDLTPATQTPVGSPAQKILRDALARLGPNGEHWGQGNGGPNRSELPANKMCAAMTLKLLPPYIDGIPYLLFAVGVTDRFEFLGWHDSPERTFADVRAMFLRAIELAA